MYIYIYTYIHTYIHTYVYKCMRARSFGIASSCREKKPSCPAQKTAHEGITMLV